VPALPSDSYWVRWGALAVLVACSPADDPTGTLTKPTAGPTVSCAEQADNVLRWDCTIDHTPGPVVLWWEPSQGGDRFSATSPSSGSEHALTLWGLRPQTEYQWTLEGLDADATGTLTTSALPASTRPDVTVSGVSTAEHLLVPLPCAGSATLAILDTDGTPIWYQSHPAQVGLGGGVEGYHFTPNRTVLALIGDDLFEHSLAGEPLRELRRGVDYPLPVHHDVFMAESGRIYLLNADVFSYPDDDYVLDGLYVIDPDGVVAEWQLADHIEPSGGGETGFWTSEFPGAVDYSHANSITVDASGTGWISFRHLNTIFQLDADPDSAGFGQLDWVLAGTADAPVASDFTRMSTPGFDPEFIAQHHANPTPDGKLALFDNHTTGLGVGSSRGVVLDLDTTAWTADVVEAYEVGTSCSAQGATYGLPSGNRLVTCATSSLIQEFEPGNPSPVWSMQVGCGDGFGLLARGMPIDL